MEDFLVFDNVSKQYGSTRAVDGVTLRIQRGEIFSLLGPSGCGKTTLLRMVAGFEPPDSGRLLLEGQDITAVPPHRRPVNTVFQNYALFPHLSVRENIAFGPRIAGKANRQAVEAMIELVKLDGHAGKKPAQLSGGQRQRVAIARALINQPRVLLLDEPLAALDLKLRQHMLGELQALHRATGTTFIFVTHDQTEAIGLSHRIAVMNAGRVEQCGTPREIYERPASGFVAEFIGDTNLLDATVRDTRDGLCTVDAGALGTLQGQSTVSLPAGARVRLCVRPESWWISATADARPNAISARVQSCLYLGAHSRWTLEASGQLLHLLVPHQQRSALPLTPGAEVWAGFDPADAQVLVAS